VIDYKQKYPFLINYKYTPRTYQIEAAEKAVETLLSNGKGVLVLGTGSGKSLIQSIIADILQEPLLLIAPNKELIQQNLEECLEQGIPLEDTAVYCAGLKRKEVGKLTYGTIKSMKANINAFKHFKYAIIDECHMASKKNGEMWKFFKEIGVNSYCGLTATPYRIDYFIKGQKLELITEGKAKSFDNIAYNLDVQTILDLEVWSKVKYEVIPFDSSTLVPKTSSDEYTEVSIQKAMKSQNVNNNILVKVRNLLKNNAKSILVFVESLEVAETFKKHTPGSEVITHETKTKDRERIVNDFKSGEIKVIYNLNTLTTGFDYKSLEYVILGKPTRSFIRHIQTIGRVVRKHKDKKFGTIIDFVGNINRMGTHLETKLIKTNNAGYKLVKDNIVVNGVWKRGEQIIDGNNNMQRMFKAFDESVAGYKLTFGKFQGKALRTIPNYYLKWLITTDDCPKEVIKYLGN